MKKLIFLSILFLVFSCIKIDKQEYFYERPTLRLTFEDQSKNPIVDIPSFTFMAYNDDFYMMEKHYLELNTKSDSLVLLRGVPENEYSIYVITDLIHATLDTSNYIVTQLDSSRSHDPIRVGYAKYHVKRGNPISPSETMILKDIYLNFKIQIVGALDISSKDDFELKVDNLPCVFDFEGGHSHSKLSSITPVLEYDRDQDIISSDFCSSKFCKNGNVMLTLTNKEHVVVSFNISNHIEDASIDMSKDNLDVVIKIYISTSGNLVFINEWEIETIKDEIEN